MAKKSIITLGGLPGSGKSTVRKLLAEKLGYETFSTGDFLRSLAVERGVTLEAINKESARDIQIDHLIDGKAKEIAASRDHVILDSHLAHHFVQDAFRVFLSVPLDESAKRIFQDRTSSTRVQSGDSYNTVEEARAHIEIRIKNHRERYREHYNLDPYDPQHFDLVIDTSRYTPEEVAQIIIKEYQKWQQK